MPTRFRKLTAWLGILAIWLVIAMPLVSQVMAARAATPATLDMPVCDAMQDAAHGVMPHAAHGHHSLHTDACGYCSFFAHTPALYAAAPAIAGSPAVHVSAVIPPCRNAVQVRNYSRAHPRAPPQNA
jgi:hypothetical protein